jgi:septal ring factor EnvC (AmiA/AmiB activator)
VVSAQASPPATPSSGTKKQPVSAAGLSLQEALSATRADLSEAQRSRSELQEQLARANAELEKLRKKNTQDQRRVRTLESEITHLQKRLKDLEGELRGKAKLLDVCSVLFFSRTAPMDSLTRWPTGLPRRDCIFIPPAQHGGGEIQQVSAGKPGAC